MRIGLKLPQRAPIDEYLTVWRVADAEGFDSLWNIDHFATVGGDPTGDIFEAWTLLAAMAECTSHVRIGCTVTGNTYRHPAVLAKMAVTVDHLSGGRLEFGLGAAWAEDEHAMLGMHFGTAGERMDRLEEACQVIRSLWTHQRSTFNGRYYRLRNAVAEPKPVQRPHPPIWIGGVGRKRTLRIAAQFADVWNAPGGTVARFGELSEVLDRHCAEVGRDPAQIRRTVQQQVRLPDVDVIAQVEEFAGAGADEVILVLTPGLAETQARQVAAQLPRLQGTS